MMFQALPQEIQDLLAVLEYWDEILEGFIMMIWLYVWALMIGFFLGLFLAILRQYGGAIISRIATGYIEIVRGTPLLAQILLLYFLPYSLNIPIERWAFYTNFRISDREMTFILLNPEILVGILALGLNSAAYQAEYLRGAITSVGTEQLVAAQSLGMSRRVGIVHIVLPQALRRVIPAWSNEAAYLPKYTIVVWYIGVPELFGKAHYLVFKEFIPEATFIIIAIIFLVLISTVSKVLDVIHKRTAIPGL
ncbi:MAG: amino acid ABC transporter permease [Promethearchaeota archaeon Loki_b32]|nr:MAG: amino acid ABC transporter permease [Candidatus Lokiarchaeota archaeon Loki_b32]